MNTRNKIERIIARNPELKETLLSLQDSKVNKVFHNIVSQDIRKIILVGKESERQVRLCELATIINYGYIHITEVTTVDLLDAYVEEDSPSLSSVVDDLVIIKDSRAYVPNKQKTNMIMQVFEQNERCIYYYKGSKNSFESEHLSLVDYARDNNIKVLFLKDRTYKGDTNEI